MDKISDKKLSIVMPVYNEEGIIEKSVRDYYNDVLLRFNSWEFIIVNDSSTDNTLSILKKLQKDIPITIVDNDKNMGHGPSLIRGYNLASGDIIFHTDSDYQFLPQDFWKLYENISKNDLVIGVRNNRKDPLFRIILAKTLKFFLRIFLGQGIRDVNSPFRLMKKEFLKEYLSVIPSDFMVPSVAMVVFAKNKKYSVKEVKVSHLARKTGKVSIVRLKLFVFCFNALKQILGIKNKLK